MYEFFFNNMQILHILYFKNPIGIKTSGPFQTSLEEWEVENKSFFREKNIKAGEALYHVCSKCCLKEILTRPS